ncbi:MAG: ABC transporter substrate-binding protein, partial [bacterium]|nr:ABC transporter substrate-binding protein [bacterium]
PLGFDSVNLLADAIRRAGSTDPGDVQAALAATTDFEGVVGKIAYAPGNRVPKKPVAVIAVDNGKESLEWVGTPD